MALARWRGVIATAAGDVVPGASVEVRREDNLPALALLKANRAGTSPLDNPLTADERGRVSFFALGGGYRIKATAVVGGLPWEDEWDWVAVGTAAETDAARGLSGGTLMAFEGATADAEPGIGAIRLNHATPSSVTFIYADLADVFGNDI